MNDVGDVMAWDLAGDKPLPEVILTKDYETCGVTKQKRVGVYKTLAVYDKKIFVSHMPYLH